MTGYTNPAPRVRYSYAIKNLPDFSIDFGISVSEDEQNYIQYIGSQIYSTPMDQVIEDYSGNPPRFDRWYTYMGYIYADAKHILMFSPEAGLPSLFIVDDTDIIGDIQNGEQIGIGGARGNITCANGVVTVTMYTSIDPEDDDPPTIVSFTPNYDNGCYYADENGEYGSYYREQISEDPYIGDLPIFPTGLFMSVLLSVMVWLYDDKEIFTSGAGDFPHQFKSVITVENDKLTEAYWVTEDGAFTTPVDLCILPISVKPMLRIPIIYDATTRRISFKNGDSAYGGATTDVDSVKLMFTGIEPTGDNFVARVDFAVPIKINDRNIIHPFILLEKLREGWGAIIPQSVLGATVNNRNKLPLQLVLASDSQVINSRNTLVLDVTQGIDANTEGNTLPQYVVPEWEVSTDTVSDDTDVHVIEVTYDPSKRMLTLDNEDSKYGGATIDTRSVKIQISGIVPDGADFGARVDFAVPIMVDERKILKPFVVLENINNVWCAMIPQAILMAAHDIKKLPFQLVIRHGDTVINSCNTVVLEITRAINSAQSMIENYMPYLMYRNDTWEWISDFTYDTGAIVVYNGEMYTSLSDGNRGYTPSQYTDKWSLLTGIENVVLDDIHGTRVGSEITFTSAQMFASAHFVKSTVQVTELDVPVVTWRAEDD